MERKEIERAGSNGIREIQSSMPSVRKKSRGRAIAPAGKRQISEMDGASNPRQAAHAAAMVRGLQQRPGGLGFGHYFTDHMLVMDYEEGAGWQLPRIVPYGPLAMDPASKTFHYGQTVFEGMKAFRWTDGQARLFRPRDHLRRLNRSCERLCVPEVDEEQVLDALRQLVAVDEAWIPEEPGTSLYIRPFIIATEPLLGVAPSRQYRFVAICSPVGAYYAEGVQPVSIYVETEHVRAVAGGVGAAKTAGNYAAGLKAQEAAGRLGCSQVLWLDGVHRKFVEEVGSMNVFFRFGDRVVTPPLGGSILAGITRDSILRLLRDWGFETCERPIGIDEVAAGLRAGQLTEAFGTGTAAVVSPIGSLHWQGEKMAVGSGGTGELSRRLYDTLLGIQRGELPDDYGWMVEAGGGPES